MATLILSHADCPDGLLSALILRRHLGGAVRFIRPREVAETLEKVSEDVDRLVLADLAFPTNRAARAVESVRSLLQRGARVTWMDHHADAWRDAPLAELAAEWIIDRQGNDCGATLALRWTGTKDAGLEQLAAIARGRDIWTEPRTERALLWVGAAETLGLAALDKVLRERGVSGVLEEGRPWKERLDREVAKLLDTPVVDDPPLYVVASWKEAPVSDAAAVLWERSQNRYALFLAYDAKRGTVSIRTRPDTPVAHVIGRLLGGGGHPNAAGGHLDRPAKDLWYEFARRRPSMNTVERLREAVRLAMADPA